MVTIGLALGCGRRDELLADPATPRAAKSKVTKGIAEPLTSDLAGYVEVDRIDVGDESDEKAHAYEIESQTYSGAHQFDLPEARASYLETGRANKSFEKFHVRLTPGKDHLLVRAFDTLAKDQCVSVMVGGKKLGRWKLPDGEDNRYGEATFLIPAATIGQGTNTVVRLDYVSGMPDTNALVYWVFAKGNTGIPSPLKVQLAGVTLVDRLDVGEASDEALHGYVIDHQTFAGTHQFAGPWGVYSETGRATKSFESFRLKVTPGKDHVLVKGFDTLSRDQKMRVSVDGKVVGEWALPNDDGRYGESTFELPKQLIGQKQELTLRIDFVSASMDMNSFVYWLYARSPGPGIQHPLQTDVKALTEMDRVDVGNVVDEKKHAYSIDKQTFEGIHEFVVGDKSYLENGRATKSFETFRVAVRPNVDNVLVKGFDTLSKGQKVHVLMDGKAVGDWTFQDSGNRYSEASFTLPARLIGGRSAVTLRLEYAGGSLDTNSFVIWVFANPQTSRAN